MEAAELEMPAHQDSLASMHALVYHGPGKRAWESHPRPRFRIRATRSSGSLHRSGSSHPEGRRFHVNPGQILGHVGIGIVDAAGTAVSSVHRQEKIVWPPFRKKPKSPPIRRVASNGLPNARISSSAGAGTAVVAITYSCLRVECQTRLKSKVRAVGALVGSSNG